MQPRVKPMNPDAQILLDELLRDPSKPMCPICGERGFYDNRSDPKRPEKAPHFKCKNKNCPGATPLKGKRPYGVWLPDDYEAPTQTNKRVESPYAGTPTDEAEHFAQSLRDDPTGRGEAYEGDAEAEQEAIEARKHTARQVSAKRYLALWDVVAAHQAAKGKELDMPVDGMSVNAATATLWIFFGNKGML